MNSCKGLKGVSNWCLEVGVKRGSVSVRFRSTRMLVEVVEGVGRWSGGYQCHRIRDFGREPDVRGCEIKIMLKKNMGEFRSAPRALVAQIASIVASFST